MRDKRDQEHDLRKVVSDRGIKFTDVRPSDMKFNKNLEIIDRCNKDEETLIQYQNIWPPALQISIGKTIVT